MRVVLSSVALGCVLFACTLTDGATDSQRRDAAPDSSPRPDVTGLDTNATDANANTSLDGRTALGDAARADGGDSRGDVVRLADGATVGPEICDNGLDDNRDGRIDEGCACLPGTSQPCYPADAVTAGVGICRRGTQGCDGAGEFGTWTECVGAQGPVEEICGDGIDQDCTGHADDDPRCLCTAGATRACYTGPTGTAGVGICHAGIETCNGSGTAFGPCAGQVLPASEICGNHIDEDCNGTADDGVTCACDPSTSRTCYPGPAGEAGRGRCRAGTQHCASDGMSFGTCTGAVTAVTEICMNSIDDNCNGTTDEGCPTLVQVPVSLNGDCLTARCPAATPYPVGCSITMAGDDPRGCVANTLNNPVVYFQEGDACGVGRVTGSLLCSNMPGTGLNATNCVINKSRRIYPADRTGCPATS